MIAGQESEREPEGAEEWLEALPGLARLASGAAWRTAGWAAGRSRRLSGRVARAAFSPREALALADDARLFSIKALRITATLLELGQPQSSAGEAPPRGSAPARSSAPVPDPAPAQDRSTAGSSRSDGHAALDGAGPRTSGQSENGLELQAAPSTNGGRSSLRERGRQLLELSRDVSYEEEAHPAYARILDDLAPDEARILLLLLLDGPQPAVDVRTGGPVGFVKSKLIAPGLSMIGAKAGARYLDRVPSYLNNLFRLGLVWFSHETLPDTPRYQLLEAQPDVLEAVKRVSYAKVVRRSIHLTPFGEDFCTTCLAPAATRLEQLPEHSLPPSSLQAEDAGRDLPSL